MKLRLHYDGHGINNADTGDRLATLSDSLKWGKNGRRNPEGDELGALLAAAPELLEALEAWVDSVGHLWNTESSDGTTIFDKARAAIAKAKGDE